MFCILSTNRNVISRIFELFLLLLNKKILYLPFKIGFFLRKDGKESKFVAFCSFMDGRKRDR